MAAGPDGTVTSTRFNRTSSNNYSNYVNNVSAYVGEQWSATMWMKSANTASYLFGPTIGGYVFGRVVSATSSWALLEVTGTNGGTNNYFQPQNGGIPSTAAFDVDMMQFERGLFPTEHIWTSGSINSRASEKLYHPDVTQLMDDGMLAIEVIFRLKGRFPSQFTGPFRLWTIDENNYAEFDPTGSFGRVCVSGVTASSPSLTIGTTTALSIYTMFSTGSADAPQFVAIVSASSGYSTSDITSAMSAGFSSLRLPSTLTGSLYFMSDASGNKALSGWIERIAVYRRSRNVPDLELPATRHPNYTRSNKVRPFADRTRR